MPNADHDKRLSILNRSRLALLLAPFILLGFGASMGEAGEGDDAGVRVHLILEGDESGVRVREIVSFTAPGEAAPDAAAGDIERLVPLPHGSREASVESGGVLEGGKVRVRSSDLQGDGALELSFLLPWTGKGIAAFSQTLPWPVDSATLVWDEGAALEVSGPGWGEPKIMQSPQAARLLFSTQKPVPESAIVFSVTRSASESTDESTPRWKWMILAAAAVLALFAAWYPRGPAVKPS